MPSTKARSFMKAMLWEGGMFIGQTIFFWAYLGSLGESVYVNIIITIFKTFILFGYERLWKKLKWGKY